MKSLLFFLFLFNVYPHHGGEPGTILINGNNRDDHGLAAALPLPVRIFEDGSVGFNWKTNAAREFSWYISPLVYLKIDRFKYLVSVLENKAISLETADLNSGYLVLQKDEFNIGLGAGITVGDSFSVGGGLIPLVGTMMYSERYAPDLESAHQMKIIDFPKKCEDFHEWQNGDLLVYTKKAGINFYASAGYFGGTAGVGFSALGNWKVVLKKTGPHKVFASVSKIDLEALSVFLGSQVVALNISEFGSRDKSFSYEFHLESKAGREAFEQFLSGNFKFTREMLENPTIEGVLALNETQTRSRGRILGLSLGIPLIGGLDFTKGLVQSFSQIHELGDQKQIENIMAVYSRSVETTGLASKSLKKVKLFSVSHQKTISAEKDPGYLTANFKWFFSQSKMDLNSFKEALNEIKRITGYWQTLDINLAQENLGYTKIEFDTMISAKGIQSLTSSDLDQRILSSPQQQIENYFEIQPEPTRLCAFYKNYKTCKAHLLFSSKNAMNTIQKKLKELRKFQQDGDFHQYTKSLAKLGEEATTNQFTFNSFLQMLGKENFKMEFKISGERLKEMTLREFDL